MLWSTSSNCINLVTVLSACSSSTSKLWSVGTLYVFDNLFNVLSFQYNIFSLIFSWFALANLWLTFSIVIDLLPALSPPLIAFGTADIVSARQAYYSETPH